MVGKSNATNELLMNKYYLLIMKVRAIRDLSTSLQQFSLSLLIGLEVSPSLWTEEVLIMFVKYCSLSF